MSEEVTFSPPIRYFLPSEATAVARALPPMLRQTFKELRTATAAPGDVLGFDGDSNLAVIPNSAVVQFESIELAATADITAFSPVVITGKIADSANLSYFGRVVGIASAAIANGFVGVVVTFGTITNSGWAWTPGSSIFLNGTALSQTAPSTGFSQAIGVAKTSDTIFVSLSDPVLL
jgi:hypothetical protein